MPAPGPELLPRVASRSTVGAKVVPIICTSQQRHPVFGAGERTPKLGSGVSPLLDCPGVDPRRRQKILTGRSGPTRLAAEIEILQLVAWRLRGSSRGFCSWRSTWRPTWRCWCQAPCCDSLPVTNRDGHSYLSGCSWHTPWFV